MATPKRIHVKEESSCPTVAIEALKLSCTIDALEERNVCIIDIPGAFMQETWLVTYT